LLEDFRRRLEQSMQTHPLLPTWSDAQRRVSCADYLSLFLFGLLNPVVRTMRGLCAASGHRRVQRQVCTRAISLGSFSEAQAVLDPELLADVFAQLSQEVVRRGPPARPGERRWLVQDGSLFAALPRMHWAMWRRQYGVAQAQVRLHLTLELAAEAPVRAAVRAGKICERAVWRGQWQRGDAYVGDRYFGEDYRLFRLMQQQGVVFVVRIREEAVVTVERELGLTAAERQLGVVRSACARLGRTEPYRSVPVRVVWVRTPAGTLTLVTNLAAEELGAGDVALLYKERWRIEVFFRWVKCLLGCRHWFAHSPRGTALQLYLTLIAALLLQLYTGQRPNRRMLEAIQFYFLGLLSLEDLAAALARQRAQVAARAKKAR
jgi:hypothetical protein